MVLARTRYKRSFIMDFESIKRLGLDKYNIDLESSYESYNLTTNNHTIILHLNKDKIYIIH